MGITIELTDEAVQTVHNMRTLVNELRACYSPGHDFTMAAESSFAHVMGTMIGLGGKVSMDGPLSLYGITSYGMHYGVIFHRSNRPRPVEADWIPQHGTWSVHS